MQGVGRHCADPDGAPARVLQNGLHVAALHGPDQRGGVGGAGGQETAAGAEAAAVDAVAVALQRREGQLGEVAGVVNPDGFVGGARGEQAAGEGAPVDVVQVVVQRANQGGLVGRSSCRVSRKEKNRGARVYSSLREECMSICQSKLCLSFSEEITKPSVVLCRSASQLNVAVRF